MEERQDLISRQTVIDEIEYELEMINSELDSITLNFNATERRLRQRRGEARRILNSIQQLPSAQSEIIYCAWCKYMYTEETGFWCAQTGKEVRLDHYCGYAERETDGDRKI